MSGLGRGRPGVHGGVRPSTTHDGRRRRRRRDQRPITWCRRRHVVPVRIRGGLDNDAFQIARSQIVVVDIEVVIAVISPGEVLFSVEHRVHIEHNIIVSVD